MNASQEHAKSIFLSAAEIAVAAERQAYIADQCGGDEALHKEVDQLLLHLEQLGPFLKTGGAALTVAAPDPISERPGSVIGPYKLLEQIGEGGFGIVFMAEQQRPVRRKVALKVIKPGMDTRQIIARFEAERQALALMDHPNIAKVLEAGATESGRPYFVMELVKGKPITEYCNTKQLTPRERLELFIPVCQAVQHAHQKGIIHRDLKPSNVLVTEHDGTPVVKVIDFGIAKATGQQLTDKTLFTNFAQMIGTPLYMSPEQAALSGLDIDTRSDIYALGVLLYELLTGTTPFDKARFREAGYDEIRRIIREEEPPKPSTRLSTLGLAEDTVSAERKSDPKRLSQICRGDLDWIVMKALEKDRTRRYETANAFAADVQRHLSDEAVEACPPSSLYKFRKFARRNKRTLVTGALVGTVLLAGIVAVAGTIGWQARDRATREQLIEQAAGEDLREAETLQKQDQWAKAFSVLERAKGRLEGSGLEALQTRVDERLGDVALVTRLEKARMQALAVSGREERNYAETDRAYRSAFADNGLDVTALTPEETARRIRASAISTHLVRALDNWAHCRDHLRGAGGAQLRAIAQLADDDPWRRRLRDPRFMKDRANLERLAEEEAVLGQAPENLLNLFIHLEEAKAHAAGIRLLLKAQQLHPADFWINYQLNFSLGDDPKRAAEAVAFGRAALALQPQSPIVYLNLANALGRQGIHKEPEAEALCRKAIEIQPNNSDAYVHLGNNQANQKKLPEAEVAFGKAIELKPHSGRAYFNLARFFNGQNKHREAEAAVRKAIELAPDFARAYGGLGLALLRQHKLPEAAAAFRKGIELTPDDSALHNNFGNVLHYQHKLPEAIVEYRKAIEVKADDAIAYANLGAHLRGDDKVPEREAALRKAIELDFSPAYENLVMLLCKQQKFDEAIVTCRKALDVDPKNAEVYNLLGYALSRQKKFVEASAAHDKAFALSKDSPKSSDFYGIAGLAASDGCGQNKDAATLDAKERARLRGQALGWLRACLAVSQKTLAKEPNKGNPEVLQDMEDWLHEEDFNGVRGAAALAKLPEAERREWHALWEDVEELRKRAAGK